MNGYAYFYDGQRVTPISPLGSVVATAGAFIIFCFYRLLGGYWFIEGDAPVAHRRYRRRRRRRYDSVAYDD